jgi:hypothetical protein
MEANIALPSEDRRKAEIEAGRERFLERSKLAEISSKEVHAQQKIGDMQLNEDLQRRDEILNAEPDYSKAARDRAGAEIVDQAQTALEAVQHLADQEDRILTVEQELAIEALTHPNADPDRATAITTDMVTAQAVNQPTVLANNEGQNTEDQPLNNGPFSDAELSQATPIPDEKHVPKTAARARLIAKKKVPDASEVVVPGWHQPDHNENENVAVDAVKAARNETALSLES